MKKKYVVTIILLSCLVCTFSHSDEIKKEITYHGIPWLSNRITTVEKMTELNKSTDQTDYRIKETGIYLSRDESINARPKTTYNYSNASTALLFSNFTSDAVADYSISRVLFTYACDDSIEQLICIKIELEHSSFDVIRESFEEKYGTGDVIHNEEGIDTCIWYGDNDTCLLLYSIDGKETTDLFYGYLLGEELLESIIYKNK